MIQKAISNMKKLIVDGFFHILLGNTLSKMIAFMTSIVIVRLITKEEYGYLSYADNLYSYINLFAGMGVSTAILKFCSPEREKGINKFFFDLALKVGSIFQIVLTIILIVYVSLVDIAFPQAKCIMYMLVLYPFLVQVETTIQSFVRSMLNNKLYAKMGVVQTIVAFGGSSILVLVVGVNGIAFARYIAIVAAIFVSVKFIRTNIPTGTVIVSPDRKEINNFWKISISLMFANLFSMIMPINEMFIINHIIRDEIVTANYKVAILIPSQITFIASSIIVYVFPKIAQMSNHKDNILKYSLKIGGIEFGIIGIVCIVGMIVTGPLVRIVYGTKYEDVIQLSLIYWIVYAINAGIRMLPMNILPALGITVFNSIISIVTCVLHAGLMYYFIIQFGIYGAAYALLIVYFISGIIYWIYLLIYCRSKKC